VNWLQKINAQSSTQPMQMTLYHGGAPISGFRGGQTLWLSTSKDVAGVNVGNPAKWWYIKSLGGNPEDSFPIETVVVSLSNPFVVDARGESYFDIPTPPAIKKSGYTDLDFVDSDIIADWAKINGYDGVVIKNVLEGKGASVVADSVAVFNPANISSPQVQTPPSEVTRSPVEPVNPEMQL